jgi:hypothetical protein
VPKTSIDPKPAARNALSILRAAPAADLDALRRDQLQRFVAIGALAQRRRHEDHAAVRKQFHRPEKDDRRSGIVAIRKEIQRKRALMLDLDPVVVDQLQQEGSTGKENLTQTAGEPPQIVFAAQMRQHVADADCAAERTGSQGCDLAHVAGQEPRIIAAGGSPAPFQHRRRRVDASDIESPGGKEPRVLAGAGAEVEETFGRGIAEQ